MAIFGPPGKGDTIARRLVLPLAGAFIVLLLTFGVFFRPVRVEGDSMYPSLYSGDRVLVTREYATPRRGDVIELDTDVFATGNGGRVLKRVVALAGDSISIDAGRAVVNGVPEGGDHLIYSASDVSVPELEVPQGHVYVLGDNRPVSLDSRFFGPVPLDAVYGRLLFRYTPVTRLGRVD